MTAASIDDLLDDVPVYTLEDYERDRAVLIERFWLEHGLCENQIDAACRDDLHHTELADVWCSLQSLAPYMKPEPDRAILRGDAG